MRTVKTTCPLDCWDQCALLVKEENGKIFAIGPDPDQPVTGNLICSKGRQHLQRLNHPDRLRYPLLKKGKSFERISWARALDLMAQNIRESLERYGPESLLHFYDGGYSGVLKNIESRFFSALGGCTASRGSLCWGAGLAAQKYDFGASVSHPPEDLAASKLVIIWGRNPASTSVHLLPYIRKAREKGARVVLIDPVRTATADICDRHIRVNPGSDGALALAMAGVLINRNLVDREFIARYCSGYERFQTMCSKYTAEWAAGITGLTAEEIEDLAIQYGKSRPAALLIGIGLQRYSNGGHTVRAIDALAALSGNIGKPGGGASYVNFRINRYIDHDYLQGNDLSPQRRFYDKPQLASALSDLKEPPVNLLYVSRANPMVQVGDSNSLARAFGKVPFIITAEHFMTDTAAASDLVLPCTTFLEEEDLFYNSMGHHYLNYSARIVAPQGECRSEHEFLKELAGLLGIDDFPGPEAGEILSRAIKPLTEARGLTLQSIQGRAPLAPVAGSAVPWSGGLFDTADRKFNFYSAAAENDGGEGLPYYHGPQELGDAALQQEGYRYWFATPHPRDSIHSTHRLPGWNGTPAVYIHPLLAERENLAEGEIIRISSPRGFIEAKTKISERAGPASVLVYEGWWHSTGAAVNRLTSNRLSDLGSQAAYYDCLCRIDKISR